MKNLRVSLSTLAAASLLTLAPVAARADAATDGQLAADMPPTARSSRRSPT